MQSNSKYSFILLMEAGSRPVNLIIYFDESGTKQNIQDNIVKINKRDEAEFILLKSGLEIPIEKIYSVDGEVSPHHSEDFFYCDCV